MKLSGGYQDIQITHALIMDPEFGLVENLMPQMIGKISQILKLYKGDPGTPTLTKATEGPYKADFIQDMTHDIKEMEKYGTCTIVSRKSVTGANILPRK